MNTQPKSPQLEDLLSQAAALLRDQNISIERRASLLRHFLDLLDSIEKYNNENKFVTISVVKDAEAINQEFPKCPSGS